MSELAVLSRGLDPIGMIHKVRPRLGLSEIEPGARPYLGSTTAIRSIRREVDHFSWTLLSAAAALKRPTYTKNSNNSPLGMLADNGSD